MFLTHYELDTGKEDQHDTIKAHEAIAMERLKAQEGRVHLPTEVEQYMFPGSGPGTKKEEEGWRRLCVRVP